MRSTALTPEQNVARTIAAVDAHFHEENPQESKGVDLYGDSVVREAPAGGVLLHGRAAVKVPYLKMFGSYEVGWLTPVRRPAPDGWVLDDTVAGRRRPDHPAERLRAVPAGRRPLGDDIPTDARP